MGFGKCHLFSGCDIMKFFIISLFLLLLFDSSQGSSSPHRRSIRALNTTLQTNFDGTYERINPCTNAEIETSSYTASHEFHHHTKEDTWSDYSHKCSRIISGFLQAIANLVRSNNNQNGIFNFHINTSISQKQDGHCDFNKQKSCDSLPIINIEATGDEIPPWSSTENSLKTEQSWERKYSISGQLSDGERITGDLLTTTPLQTQHNEISTSAPQGQDIFYSSDYPTTPQCQTTSISLKDTPPVYPPQPVKQNFEREQTLQNGLLTATQTPNSVPSFAPQFAGTAIPAETSPAVFNLPLNRPTTYEPEQKPDFYGISPEPVFNPNVPNTITLPPENEFPTAPFPTACEPFPPNTFEKPPTSAVTYPENPEPLNPISSSPIPFNEETDIPRTIPSQPFYDSTQDFNQKPITVNNEEQLIQNQYQPFLVGGEGPQTVDSRQPFSDNLCGRLPESQHSTTPIIPVLPPNQADMPLRNPQIPPNFMGSAVSAVPVPVEFSQSGFPSDASSFSIPPQFPDAILSNTKTQNQAITSATVRLENDEISATNPPQTDKDFLIDSRPTIPNDRQTPAPEFPTTCPVPSGETNLKILPTDFATSESSFPTESLVLDQKTTKTIDVIESGFTDAPFPSNIGTQPTPNILYDNRPTTLTPQQQFPTIETYGNQNYNEFSPMTTQRPNFFIPVSQPDPNSYNNEPYLPNVNGKFLSTPVESTQFPINPEPFTPTVSDLDITPKTELPYTGPSLDSDSASVTSTFQAIATTKVQHPQSLILSDFATPKPEILRTTTEKTAEIFEIPQNPTTPTLLSIPSEVQTTAGPELLTSAEYTNESGEPGPFHSTFNNKNMPNILDQSQSQITNIPPLSQFPLILSPNQQPTGGYQIPPQPTYPHTNGYATDFENMSGPALQTTLGLSEDNNRQISQADVPPEQELITNANFNQFPSTFSQVQKPIENYDFPIPPTSPPIYEDETTTAIGHEFQPPIGLSVNNKPEIPVIGVPPQNQVSTIPPLNQLPSTFSPEQQPIGQYEVSPPSVSRPTYDYGSMTPEFQNTPGPEYQTPLPMPDINNRQSPYTEILPDQLSTNAPFNQISSTLSPGQQPMADYTIPEITSSPPMYTEATMTPELQTSVGFPVVNNPQIPFTDVPPEQQVSPIVGLNPLPSSFSPGQQPIGESEISPSPLSPPTNEYGSVTAELQNTPGPEFQTPLPMPDINNRQSPYIEIPPDQLSTNAPFNQLPSTLSPGQQPLGDYTVPEITSYPPMYTEATMTPELQTSVGFPVVNNPQIPFTGVPPEQQVSTIPPFNQFLSTLSPEQQPIGQFETSPPPIPPPTQEYAPMASVFQNMPGPEFQNPLPMPDINNRQSPYIEIPPDQLSTNTPFNQISSTLSPGQQPMADHTIPEITSSPPMSEGGTMKPEFQNTQGPELKVPLGLPDLTNPQITFTDVTHEQQVSAIPPLNQFLSTFSQVQQPTENNEFLTPTTSPRIYDDKTTPTVAAEFKPPIGLTVVNKPEIPFTAIPPEQQVSPPVGFNPIPSTFSPEQRPTEFQPQFGLPAVNNPETTINAIPPEQQVSTIPPVSQFPSTSSQEQLPTSPPTYDYKTTAAVASEFQPPTGLPVINNPETPVVGIPPEQQVSPSVGLNPLPSSFSPEQQPIGEYEISPSPLSPPTNEYGSMTAELQNTPGPAFQTPVGIPDMYNPQLRYTDVPSEQQLTTTAGFNQLLSTLSPEQQPGPEYEMPEVTSSPPMSEGGTMRPELQNTLGPEFHTPPGFPVVNNPQIPFTDVPPEQQVSTIPPLNQIASTLSSEQQPIGQYEVSPSSVSPLTYDNGSMTLEFQNTPGPEFQTPLPIPDINNCQSPYTEILPDQLSTNAPFNQLPSTLSPGQQPLGDYKVPEITSYPPMYPEVTMRPEFQTPLGLPDVNNPEIPFNDVPSEQLLPTNANFNQFPPTFSPEQEPTEQYEISSPSISSSTFLDETTTTVGSELHPPTVSPVVNNPEMPFTGILPEQQDSTQVNLYTSTYSPEQQSIGENKFQSPLISPPTHEYATMRPEFQTTVAIPDVNNPQIPCTEIPPEQKLTRNAPQNQFPSTLNPGQQPIEDYDIPSAPTSPPPFEYETTGPEFQTPVGLPTFNNLQSSYTGFPPEEQFSTNAVPNQFPASFSSEQEPSVNNDIREPPTSATTYVYETTTIAPEIQPAFGLPDVNNQQKPFTGITPEEQVLHNLTFNQFSSTSQEQSPITPPTYDYGSMTPEFQNVPGLKFQTPVSMPDINNQQIAYTDVPHEPQLLSNAPFNQFSSTFSPEKQPLENYEFPTPPTSPPIYEDKTTTTVTSDFQPTIGFTVLNKPEIPFTAIPPEQQVSPPVGLNPLPSSFSPEQRPIGEYEISPPPLSPATNEYGSITPEFQNTLGPEFHTPPGFPVVNNPQIPFTDVPPEQQVSTIPPFKQFPSTSSQEPPTISPPTYDYETTTAVTSEFQPPTGLPVINNPETPVVGIPPEQQVSPSVGLNPLPSSFSPEQQPIGQYEISPPPLSPPTNEYGSMTAELQNTPGPAFQTPVGIPDMYNPQLPYTEIPPEQFSINTPFNQLLSTLSPEQQPGPEYKMPEVTSSPPMSECGTIRPELQSVQGPEFQTLPGFPVVNNPQIPFTDVPPEQQVSPIVGLNPLPSGFLPEQQPIGEYEISPPPLSPPTNEYASITPEFQNTPGPEFQTPVAMSDVNNPQIPYTEILPDQLSTNAPFNQISSTLSPGQQPMADYTIPEITSSPPMYTEATMTPELQTSVGFPVVNNPQIPFTDVPPEQQVSPIVGLNPLPSSFSPGQQPIGESEISPSPLSPPTNEYGSVTAELQNTPGPEFQTPLPMPDINNRQSPYIEIPPDQLSTNAPFNQLPSTLSPGQQPLGDYTVPEITSYPPMYPEVTMRPEFQTPLGLPNANNPEISFTDVPPEQQLTTIPPVSQFLSTSSQEQPTISPPTLNYETTTTVTSEFQPAAGMPDVNNIQPRVTEITPEQISTIPPLNQIASTLSPEQQPIGQYEVSPSSVSPLTYDNGSMTLEFQNTPGPEFQTPLPMPDINNRQSPYTEILPDQLSTNAPFNQLPSTLSPGQQPLGDYKVPEITSYPPMYPEVTMRPELQNMQFQTPLGLPDVNSQIPITDVLLEQQVSTIPPLNQISSTFSAEQQTIGQYESSPPPVSLPTEEYVSTTPGPEFQTPLPMPDINNPQIPYTDVTCEQFVPTNANFNEFTSTFSPAQQPTENYKFPTPPTSPPTHKDETMRSLFQSTIIPEFQAPIGLPDINNQQIPYPDVQPEPQFSSDAPFNQFPSTVSPEQEPLVDYDIPEPPSAATTYEDVAMTTPSPPTGPTQQPQNSLDHSTEILDYTIKDSQGQTSNTFDNSSPFQPEALTTNGLLSTTTLLPTYTNGPDKINTGPDLSLLDAQSESQRPDQEFGSNFNVPTPLLGYPQTDDRPDLAFVSPAPEPITNDGTSVKYDGGTTLPPEFGPTPEMNNQQFSPSISEIPDTVPQYQPTREPTTLSTDLVDPQYATSPGQQIEHPQPLSFQPRDQVPKIIPFNNQQFNLPTDQLFQPSLTTNPASFGQFSSTVSPEYLSGEPVTTSEYHTPEPQPPFLNYPPQISDAESQSSQTEQPQPITTYDQPSTLFTPQPPIELYGETVPTTPQINQLQSVDYTQQPSEYNKPEPELPPIPQENFSEYQPTSEVYSESILNGNIGRPQSDSFVSFPPLLETTPSDIPSQTPPFEAYSDGTRGLTYGTMSSYQTPPPTFAPEKQTTEPPHFGPSSTDGPLNSYPESEPKIAQEFLATDFPLTDSPADNDSNRLEVSSQTMTTLQPYGSPYPDQLNRYNVRNRPDRQLPFGGTTTPQYLENSNDQRVESPPSINTTERPELDQQQIVLENPISSNYADYDQGFSTPPPELTEYGEITPDFTPRDPPLTDHGQFVTEDSNVQQFGIAAQRETDSPLGFGFEERSPPNSNIQTYPPPQQNQRSNPLLQTLESQMPFPMFGPPQQIVTSSYPEQVSVDPRDTSSTPFSFEPQNQNGVSTDPPYYPGGNFKRNLVTSQPIVNTAQDVTNIPLSDSQALVSDLSPIPSNKPDGTTARRVGYMSRPLRNPYMRSIG